MIITPESRMFSPKELDYVPVRSNVVTPLQFRGGRRLKQPQSDTVTKEKKKMYREKAKKRLRQLP